jgi:hypothetical protein
MCPVVRMAMHVAPMPMERTGRRAGHREKRSVRGSKPSRRCSRLLGWHRRLTASSEEYDERDKCRGDYHAEARELSAAVLIPAA